MTDPVISAVIGASVAVIGLVVSKEGKTSEFRQQWIDALRTDIAFLISHDLERPLSRDSERPEGFLRVRNECQARILLRLNPGERDSKVLTERVEQLVKLNAEEPRSEETISKAADQLVSATQVVLKKEWKRVKRGEWKYVMVLSLASLSLAWSLAILLRSQIQHLARFR